jgi:hypothetical protein
LKEIINHQETPHTTGFNAFGNVNTKTCTLFVPAGSVDAYRSAREWGNFFNVGVIGDAGSVVIGGKAGELTWTLNNDETLTISGTGMTPDFYDGMKSSHLPSWIAYQESIVHVVIEEGVTGIGCCAFYCYSSGCYKNLSSVTIAGSVTSIGYRVFASCSGLFEIVNESITPQTIDEYVFDYVDISACTLRVPETSIDAYRKADVWKDFGKIVAN